MSNVEPIRDVKIKRTQLFIDNEYVDSVSGKTFETINPTNEQVICQVIDSLTFQKSNDFVINMFVELGSRGGQSGR